MALSLNKKTHILLSLDWLGPVLMLSMRAWTNVGDFGICSQWGLGAEPLWRSRHAPPKLVTFFALWRQILTKKIDTNISLRSNVVWKKFIFVLEHLSHSCWLGCFGLRLFFVPVYTLFSAVIPAVILHCSLTSSRTVFFFELNPEVYISVGEKQVYFNNIHCYSYYLLNTLALVWCRYFVSRLPGWPLVWKTSKTWKCTKFGQLILWKIIKIVANRRHITTVARGDTPSMFP